MQIAYGQNEGQVFEKLKHIIHHIIAKKEQALKLKVYWRNYLLSKRNLDKFKNQKQGLLYMKDKKI